MPDVEQKTLPGVPKNLDKALWDFLLVVKHNLEVLGGFKGTITNKGVTFGDVSSSVTTGLTQIVTVANIDDPSPELLSLSASANGNLLVAAAGDEYTIYSWRAAVVVADIPYVVTGNGGGWIAIAGKHIHEEVSMNQLTASRLVETDGNKKLQSFTGPLSVPFGGTGLATITDHGILIGSGAGAVTPLGVATNGQIPIGSTNNDPVLAAILGTANQVTVTLGAGSITLSLPQDLAAASSPTFAALALATLTLSQNLIGTPDEITATDAGVAASVSTLNTEVTTNGDTDLDDVTLANGISGQVKHIYCVAVGNAADSYKITPANMVGGTQITFAASPLGLGCTLVYADNEGWVVAANNGGVIS